ncbi:MAG: hypothetical protein QG673_991 [Pseudomonadota bacterium]|nr:hypothetical protein [Pseudomonadota bacterium]
MPRFKLYFTILATPIFGKLMSAHTTPETTNFTTTNSNNIIKQPYTAPELVALEFTNLALGGDPYIAQLSKNLFLTSAILL